MSDYRLPKAGVASTPMTGLSARSKEPPWTKSFPTPDSNRVSLRPPRPSVFAFTGTQVSWDGRQVDHGVAASVLVRLVVVGRLVVEPPVAFGEVTE
jgi:hypothetical protein